MTLSNLDWKMQNPFKDIDRIKDVHEKIQQILDRERPDTADFKGIVADEKIKSDTERVKFLEEQWEKNNSAESWDVKRKADIAEYIIYKNMGGWINQKALPLVTSKEDDYLRGVDLIIESEDDKKDMDHLGIGIDIALASEKTRSDSVEKKTKKMEQILKTGRMTEARYVSGGSYTGSIDKLPYTILSVSPSHIESLFTKALIKKQTDVERDHVLKYIIAYQIVLQLNTYHKVADALGHHEMAHEYGVANNFAVEIFSELTDKLYTDPELWERVSGDVGMQEIMSFCEGLEKNLTNKN